MVCISLIHSESRRKGIMKLLVVEDERSLSRALIELLRKNGYTADAVFDGREALSYLENGDYDGMILDVMLPGLDGFEVLKRIRESGNVMPILMLTARSEIDDTVAGLDGGANDYMTKPFSPKELLARIRAMTREKGAVTGSVLKVGNISLNQATNELSSTGGSFQLTNKEFQVMEFLMQNHGNLIPSERLLEKVWGYDADVEINVVWVYISYLRKKLEALRANVQIKAVRNAGYTLEVL